MKCPKCQERQGRYEKLLEIAKKSKKYRSKAKTEESRLQNMIEFEVESNRTNKNWTFRDDGLTRLNDDFFLLNEHLERSESVRFDKWCQKWSKFALSQDEQKKIDNIPEELRPRKIIEKVRPLFEPLWSFYIALCHILQEGENALTATDAFYLGLVDEVIGIKGLSGFREIADFAPPPPKIFPLPKRI